MTTATLGDRAGTTYSGTHDAQLRSGNPTNNFSTETESGGVEMLLRFPGITSIPAGSTVTDAFITLNVLTGQSGSETVHFQRILRDWIENQATWNVYSTGNSWGTAGCNATSDRDAADSCVISYPGSSATGDINSTSNTNLISEIQAIVNGTQTNNGWKFVAAESMGMPAHGTASVRPLLTVTYTANAAPVPSGVSSSPAAGTTVADIRPPPPYTLTRVTG